ncbi:MAG: YmdB family metallophosphoesterase [Dysosmobacter sp.]
MSPPPMSGFIPTGTGYITDLGMTGPIESVLGVESAQSVESFFGRSAGALPQSGGALQAAGAILHWTAPPASASPWSGWTFDKEAVV